MEPEQTRRQRLYRVSAIVLKRRDQGEADRLLTVLTRDRGKLTLLAKGVRRQASRKAGHIEPFTHVDLLVAKGKSLDLVTQAETIEAHRGLREDLWRSTWPYYVAVFCLAVRQAGATPMLTVARNVSVANGSATVGSRQTVARTECFLR
jgi:DNA repair protein RecO (recombination protein O)